MPKPKNEPNKEVQQKVGSSDKIHIERSQFQGKVGNDKLALRSAPR
jgi:hypothetical protein